MKDWKSDIYLIEDAFLEEVLGIVEQKMFVPVDWEEDFSTLGK
jgi:hypothetical protein